MKFSPRTKKILGLSLVLLFVLTTTGCAIPRNEDGTVKLITTATTFSETMSSENWFSAIFVWPLSQMINYLSPKIGVGAAIALVTIIVNAILIALTMKSTIAQQRMQMIQPELERIQRKYEGRDDQTSKMRQASEMQALYKKYDINPASVLLVTFLQFPVIMAMYMSVHRSEAVQNGTFLGLSLQKTPLQGFKDGQYLYIVLFLIMVAAQFLSMKIPEIINKKRAEETAKKQHRKPAETTSSQAMTMQYSMLAMIAVFGLMWPTAMTVYWIINSLVNIGKTFIVQRVIEANK